MKEKVMIRLKGLHLQDQGTQSRDVQNAETEELEMLQAGRYRMVGNREYIRYEEMLEEENQTVVSLIKIDDEAIEIIKRGPVETHFIFRQGKRTSTLYHTPYGTIPLEVYSSKVALHRQDEKIHIQIAYALNVDKQHLSDCDMEIEITSVLSD